MNRLLSLAKRVDLQRVAGINRILGVDLTDEMVRVVDLEKRGSWLNKYTSVFKPVHAYHRQFPAGASLEEQARQTKDLLKSCEMTTTYAVSSVRTAGVKVLTAIIPAGVDSIDEWIGENYERLLKLPLPLNQVTYGYEILRDSETETLVEITFVRNSDIDRYQSFFKQVGLHLLALGAGTRDAVNAIITESKYSKAENITLVYVDLPILSVTQLNHGYRQSPHSLPLSDGNDLVNAVAGPYDAEGQLLIAGPVDDKWDLGEGRVAAPFGLRGEETLAAGLAVKGFLPEISPMSFLSGEDKDVSEGLMYKSLATRLALGLGAILVLLLGGQFMVSSLIGVKRGYLEQQFASASPEYSAISVLQRDVESLERKLTGATRHGTSLARILHNIASATPEHVWLYRVRIVNDVANRPALSLFGYSTSNEAVAEFLKRLSGVCSEATLVRSSLPLQSETAIPVVGGKGTMMTFEIRAAGKD